MNLQYEFANLSGQKGELPQADKPERRIAYLTSHYPKVSHSFIRREIQALEQRGWEICRFSIRGWDSDLVDRNDVEERARTTFVLKAGAPRILVATMMWALTSPVRFIAALGTSLRMAWRSDRPMVWHLFYLAEACWLATRLTARNITHVHTHFGTNSGDVALLVQKLIGISYSLTIHGPEEFDRARAVHLAEKINRSAFTVAVSSFGRSQIFRILDSRSWNKVHVIRCGVDDGWATPSEVAPAFNDRLVCVGRLCEQKGQLLLVRALATLAAEGRRFKMIFVGDGEDRDRIERAISEHHLSNFVEITGWASAHRVREEMLAARALILPSFAEGLPIVLIEAMLLGRPVISTHIAGIPELVTDGEVGWLVPAGSEYDLVAAMRACLDAPREQLQRMGEAARSRASHKHGIADQAEKLSTLLEQVLS